MPETQDALIARLEAATGPDEELDGEIALIAGWTYGKRERERQPWWRDAQGYRAGVGGWDNRPPPFTGSFDKARTLSDWLLVQASDIGADGLPLVILGNPGVTPPADATGIGATLPLCMCIAALKART